MVYLLATFANDADHMPSLLHALADELDVPEAADAPETWGVGYYADARALIIKKPASILTRRSVYELAPEVRSRIVIACADRGQSRAGSPPYRFRQWLFGYTGDLSPLDVLRTKIAEKLPNFVRSDLGDESGGSLAFGMFLSELHRSVGLEDSLADGTKLGGALARTADTIRRLSAEANGDTARASFVASNGRVVLVSQAGAPMARKLQTGLERLPAGPPDPALTDFKQLAEALKRFRAVVVAPGDMAGRPDWSEIAEGQTLAMDAQLQVTEI